MARAGQSRRGRAGNGRRPGHPFVRGISDHLAAVAPRIAVTDVNETRAIGKDRQLRRHRQVFVNGVNVVLCGNADRFQGASIAWGTKVEQDHAIISLPRHAAVTTCIRGSAIFTISVLSSGQADIARQYGGKAQSGPCAIDAGALDFAQWETPVVKDACAQLRCAARQTIAIEDQELVIARILDATACESLAPLIYDHDHYFPT
ncbi:MAG: flavin reductase [Pseudomonadota bacterium]